MVHTVSIDRDKVVDAIADLRDSHPRGTLQKAITDDAISMLERILEDNDFPFECIVNPYTAHDVDARFLRGEKSWRDYSNSSKSLTTNEDIARHYLPPSKFEQKRKGRYAPNSLQTWKEYQAEKLRSSHVLARKYLAAC